MSDFVYSGIFPETLFLMEENRFRDSKAFYEEHKEEIKKGITVPMRQIAAIFAKKLYKADDKAETDPVKMVSRVRRDTRFTKDKHLYRDNMWVMFMRNKHKWQNYPCMWFEVTPRNFSFGVGFFGSTPALMSTMREKMRETPQDYIKAIKGIKKLGFGYWGEQYKKAFEGCPKGLEEYYNAKNFGFIAYETDMSMLSDGRVIELLDTAYDALIKLYKLMLIVSDECYANGEE